MTRPEEGNVSQPPPSSDGADRTRIVVSSAPEDGTRIANAPVEPAHIETLVEPGVLINDNYRILKLVSAGGMGEVYRAENIFTGDPVAVKIILPNLARDESIIDLFRREARILVQMRDDAIVRYHNFVRDKNLGRYCLIMEFVEGQHLWDMIHEVGQLDDDQALILMRRLARGLAQAHSRGITHRDLSPDNVILRENRFDEAVLIDFGIARSTELGDGLGGRFAGKFKYIAPEQLGHGRGEIGPPADIYGLALMIAAAVRGKPLDMGSSIVEASEARRAIPDLSGISHRIYPLLQHMLEPDPDMRPRNMDALLRIMDDPNHLPARYRLPLWRENGQASRDDPERSHSGVLSQLTGSFDPAASASPFGQSDPTPAVESRVPQKKRSGRTGLFAGTALVLLLLGGGLWWFAIRKSAEPPTEPIVQQDPEIMPLPARDLDTREGFLASEPLPACTFATRLNSGPDAGKIGTLADGPRDFKALQNAYATRFGVSPAIASADVTTAQCPALDFLSELSGRPALPPALSLDSDTADSGMTVSGRIRELSGRSLWLFVVSPKGGVYDLSSTATVQADGSFAFDFGISLSNETTPQRQVIIAVASDKPLTTVAAAPSGVDAGALLPLALDEIRKNGGAVGVDVAILTVSPQNAEPQDAPAVPAVD